MKKIIGLIVLMMAVVGMTFAQTANTEDNLFYVLGAKEVEVEHRKPAEGMRFVAFDILVDMNNGRYANMQGGGIWNNTPMIEVRDSNYRTYKVHYHTYDLVKPTLTPRIDPHDKARGWIVIEIPANIPIIGLQIRVQGYDFQTKWITLK